MNKIKIAIIKKKLKKKPSVKTIFGSIRNIKSGLKSVQRKNSVLYDKLDIQHGLLYLTLLAQAQKSGFKKGVSVIFKRDNTEHKLIMDVSYLDKDSLELAVDLDPRPKVKYLNNKEFPIRLSHIKLNRQGKKQH